MIDAHHVPSSQADECIYRGQFPIIRPGIEDAYLCLGEAERRFHIGNKRHALLNEVVAALVAWDGVEQIV